MTHLNNVTILYCRYNPIYEIIGKDISKLKILQKFIELFYTIKCRNRLRNYLWERVRRPKIEAKYNPENLIKLIEGKEHYDDLIEDW